MRKMGKPLVKGPWSLGEIEDYLDRASVPMRLAVNGKIGYPLVTPLWFVWADRSIWAATQPRSRIAKALSVDPRCAFDISVETIPYHGVRGQGEAVLEPDGRALLERLHDRYCGAARTKFRSWLLDRGADEIAIRITPRRLTAWDFSSRMV